MNIAIIILHYNRPEEVIESLRKMASLHKKHEFIVVDNGSDSEKIELLESHVQKDSVKLIKLPHNIGSCAWDFGAIQTEAEVIIKLDDDSHIESDDLTILSERFNTDQNLGIIPLAVEGGPFPCNDVPAYRRGTSVGYIGCGVAFRKTAFFEVGGHDPNFFIYADEWDLSIRVINAGFEIDRERSIRVRHRAPILHQQPEKLLLFTARNETIIMRKYFKRSKFVFLLFRVLIRNIQRGFKIYGWFAPYFVCVGVTLGLFDIRVKKYHLKEPEKILYRIEKWMFAFRPLKFI